MPFHKNHKIKWFHSVFGLILGLLIAMNVFLLWGYLNQNQEIKKLKADDVALAQVINKILTQLEISNK